MIEHNVRLLGHHDLNGATGGEGMAIRLSPNGQRFLFVAHLHAPDGFSVLDVTEPSQPRLVYQEPTATAGMRTNSLALFGDVLLVANQSAFGESPAGVVIYDVARPAEPRRIGFFDTSGPESRGTHFVGSFDGTYAHLSTGARDFRPITPRDDHFYMIVDVSDPSRPHEVGRWWLPGQEAGDGIAIERHTAPSIDQGFRLHHALTSPHRADRVYLGYIDAGVVILDIADRAHPTLVSRFDYHPPLPGFTHTVLPLAERDLLVVADEASGYRGDDGYDWPKRVWLVDARSESNLVFASTMPDPENFAELHRVGGRIGSHNIHENEPTPGTARLVNSVAMSWFSAGMRIYDIRDMYRPEEIAAFLPETPPGQRGSRINDVFVEDRGIVHALDRAGGGLYILEYTGAVPLT